MILLQVIEAASTLEETLERLESDGSPQQGIHRGIVVACANDPAASHIGGEGLTVPSIRRVHLSYARMVCVNAFLSDKTSVVGTLLHLIKDNILKFPRKRDNRDFPSYVLQSYGRRLVPYKIQSKKEQTTINNTN